MSIPRARACAPSGSRRAAASRRARPMPRLCGASSRRRSASSTPPSERRSRIARRRCCSSASRASCASAISSCGCRRTASTPRASPRPRATRCSTCAGGRSRRCGGRAMWSSRARSWRSRPTSRRATCPLCRATSAPALTPFRRREGAMFPDRLLAGYRAFLDERLARERARFEALAERGQSPEIMVIGCCDSRVSPEVIFDASPGELFVVRNVANLVPPYAPDGAAHGVSAALEFAVQVLRVKHIVVLGHAQCGGIRAFVDDIDPLSPGDFIGRWMQMFIKPGEQVSQREHESRQDFTTRIEKAAVFRSLENLMTFPFVRNSVERGEMSLHGAYFGVAEGSLFVLDPEAKEFRSVKELVGE